MGVQIGPKLVELRGSKTIVEVAKAVGVSPQAMGMYENNHRVPRDHIKVRIARYYGVSVEELFYASQSHVS